MLTFAFHRKAGEIALSRRRKNRQSVDLSRREFIGTLAQGASFAFLPSGLAFPSLRSSHLNQAPPNSHLAPAEYIIHPQYRSQRDIESIFRKVPAGFDDYVTEKYQDQVAAVLAKWSAQLLDSPQNIAALREVIAEGFRGASLEPVGSQTLRPDSPLKLSRLQFSGEAPLPLERFFELWRSSMSAFSKLLVAEFQVTSIRVDSATSSSTGTQQSLITRVRFELVGTGEGFYREQRVGNWELRWSVFSSGDLRLRECKILDEQRARSTTPVFVDMASHAFGANPSFSRQLLHGTDYWRTVLDSACGIDIYGHNGVSVGDIDGDGFDDLYICQPGGLPNRLFRNRGDGTFEDITESSGVGVLDNTACALFADIDNAGRQDLIVVRANGPLLFRNEGGGKFRHKPDAFQFAKAPQGTFTGAAIADYDRDGWLDIYFCLYAYYQGADQYRYPCPYFAAENGPPNFLMRNRRDGTFADVTQESGLHVNNTRFSFCCGWGEAGGKQWPDLYVVNDFGRKNLYRNNGDGTFTDIAQEAGVEDVGAGMSVSWFDYNSDGKQDLYVANMWTAAGLRISEQSIFQKNAGDAARSLYRKHAMGNSIFRNLGANGFADETMQAGAAMGRWSWSSDAWDFDHDGFPDLYVANGMISGLNSGDLNSFFWRQVVANSPADSKPNRDYEMGWNAINELIREDHTWSGFERNVFYLNNHDGTFSDVSGIVGLDFIEDSRTFALADFDHDGRIEVLLKNRSGPQIRLLKNTMPDLGPAIAFRLQGTKSNRDAIGAAITLETDTGRQTLHVQAGSGFLAQHSKELFFGLGKQTSAVKASIRWPGGLLQDLGELAVNHRIWVEEGSPPSRKEAFRVVQSRSTITASDSTPENADFPAPIETWLLAPVAAPDFSLKDQTGASHTLASTRGRPVLLYFWNSASPQCQKDLKEFSAAEGRWISAGVKLLALCADDGDSLEPILQTPSKLQLNLPLLRATPDVLTIYNLLFRSLFDRHRDIRLPTAFLLDAQGDVVKVYQGPTPLAHFERDALAIPKTSAQRLAKALPFPGVTETYDFGRNYLSYGSVFFERGYREQAEAFFELAARDDPSSSEAQYGLGSVYLQQQKLTEARASFELAVKLQANYPGTLSRAWNNLGIVAVREGKTPEAIQNFEQSLKIDPRYNVALNNLGNAYRQAKQWDEARNAFQRALALDQADPEANYGLGMVFAQQGDSDRAYELLQKALAARPVYPEALNNLGILYIRTKRPAEAEATLKECIRVAPAFDQAYLNLARLYSLQGQNGKARAVLQDLLKQRPGHPQAEKEMSQLPQ